MTTTLDIFIHMDAVNRNEWQGAADERPLTDLGRKQAEIIAERLGSQEVDAVFSSPAARCQQSLEPLAKKAGVKVANAAELVAKLKEAGALS